MLAGCQAGVGERFMMGRAGRPRGEEEATPLGFETADVGGCTTPCIQPQHLVSSWWRQWRHGTVFLVHPKKATAHSASQKSQFEHSSTVVGGVRNGTVSLEPLRWTLTTSESSVLSAVQEPSASVSQSYLSVVFWLSRREHPLGLCRALRTPATLHAGSDRTLRVPDFERTELIEWASQHPPHTFAARAVARLTGNYATTGRTARYQKAPKATHLEQ